jgi:hypothetical protein
MDACKVMDWEAQSHPDRFMRFDFAPRLTDVRQRIAALIGAKTDECVLVPNASTGISTILRNIQWTGDNIIVVCEKFTCISVSELCDRRFVSAVNTSFRSVAHAAQFISDIPPHPAVSKITLTFPTTPAQVITQFRDHLRRLPRKADQKTVAIIDSIISVPGILLLWKEMVQVCKTEGVMSVIDAAHSIGQETNLDLNTADPDFWTSVSPETRSLELWLPYISELSQMALHEALLRTICSTSVCYLTCGLVFWGYRPTMNAETSTLSNRHSPRQKPMPLSLVALSQISWSNSSVSCFVPDPERRYSIILGTPTIDFVPYLSVSAGQLICTWISPSLNLTIFVLILALDFRQWLGVEEKINTYCRTNRHPRLRSLGADFRHSGAGPGSER